ncbi:hypothetical protein J2Z64_001306 [Oceanobacillus polygoni]|uniref:Uncharacterized protein n=1 Tax=Oceanobacillus polygoni TaxID=1235259 RepID=A0A9X0YTL5_9BACI|nr:hypothetical protein [Oceanobacillus polygoni]
MPIPPGVFGPGGRQGQRICVHPQTMMPHYMWVPINRYYW